LTGEDELLRRSRLEGEGEPLCFREGDERDRFLGDGELSFFFLPGEGVRSFLLCLAGEGDSFPDLESFLCRGLTSRLPGDRDLFLTGE
jgi:hypothetical protein